MAFVVVVKKRKRSNNFKSKQKIPATPVCSNPRDQILIQLPHWFRADSKAFSHKSEHVVLQQCAKPRY